LIYNLIKTPPHYSLGIAPRIAIEATDKQVQN